MGAGGGHGESDALGSARQLATGAKDLVAQFARIGANASTDFDDRLVQLALDLIAQHRRARGQQLGHMRAQFAALRVDNLEFLLDAEREGHGLDHTSVDSRSSVSSTPFLALFMQGGSPPPLAREVRDGAKSGGVEVMATD